MSSTTPNPTFLTEARPNLILFPSGVKSANEVFTSGGRTSMPNL